MTTNAAGMVLFIIFLCLKITGHIHWSWWAVFAPLMFLALLALMAHSAHAAVLGDKAGHIRAVHDEHCKPKPDPKAGW